MRNECNNEFHSKRGMLQAVDCLAQLAYQSWSIGGPAAESLGLFHVYIFLEVSIEKSRIYIYLLDVEIVVSGQGKQ